MKRLVTFLALTLAAAAPGAWAQSGPYPYKPIKMYVGFSAGSATDIVARVVAKGLGDRLGQAVVVENRTGAGGSLAAETVARSAPDGYTLLTVSSAIAVNPAVYTKLSFDVERDLSPIANVGTLPLVLMVNRSLPATNVREFVQHARTRPGQLNYGSSGIGGSIHLATELLASVAGVKFTHVPYRGNAQAVTALLAGEINMLIDTVLLAAPNLKSDKVLPLAITGAERSPLAPDLPTFAEAGLPDYNAGLFFGVMGPAGMPKEVLDKLNAEINEVLKSPEVINRLSATGGLAIVGGSSAKFGELIAAELARWKRIAQLSGAKAE
ncbi:MAG: tripartite tricarboxylate transporter substrate binding protein [Pseudomonadota bacterium]|nr:tripartite tricarboxylate transporter substrate binding protein [Pseudomonadota bacterium]